MGTIQKTKCSETAISCIELYKGLKKHENITVHLLFEALKDGQSFFGIDEIYTRK